MAWLNQQLGYPQRHYEAVRSAKRCAIRAIAITGLLAVLLVACSIYDVLPPVFGSIGLVVFGLFGLLGGLGGLYDTVRYVRLIPYFKSHVGEIDTYLNGQTLARHCQQLDDLAQHLRVRPISYFGFNDDLRNEPLTWHAPADGLHTVSAILKSLEENKSDEGISNDVLADLKKWRDALGRASEMDIPFCVLLLHGNSTSGHEWSIRKGTAF